MSYWGKEDLKSWKNSEVMTELEKIVLAMMEKEAQEANEISNKLDKINQEVSSTSENMSQFLDMAKNLANDKGEYEADDSKEEEVEDTEQLYQEAKQELLRELEELAMKAADDKNYKLAYKIERTIDSIVFEE